MHIFRALNLLCLITLAMQQPAQASYNHIKVAAGIALAGGCYYWLRTPLKITPDHTNLHMLTFIPTKTPEGTARDIDSVCKALQEKRQNKNNNQHIILENKIFNLSTTVCHDKNAVLVYVSGYSGMCGNARYKYVGSGAFAFSKYANFIPEDIPCVTFDGPVNYRRTFTFGQQLDQECLRFIVQEVIKQNPQAKIILFGSCRGAVTVQNFATDPSNADMLQQVSDILLESPSISLDRVATHIANEYVPKPLRFLLSPLFKTVFPNYRPQEKTILDNAAHLPAHIKVHIACLPHDHIASYNDILSAAEALRNAHKQVDVFVCKDTAVRHGKLHEVKEFRDWASDIMQNA